LAESWDAPWAKQASRSSSNLFSVSSCCHIFRNRRLWLLISHLGHQCGAGMLCCKPVMAVSGLAASPDLARVTKIGNLTLPAACTLFPVSYDSTPWGPAAAFGFCHCASLTLGSWVWALYVPCCMHAFTAPCLCSLLINISQFRTGQIHTSGCMPAVLIAPCHF
jgi:hypothetical protein